MSGISVPHHLHMSFPVVVFGWPPLHYQHLNLFLILSRLPINLITITFFTLFLFDILHLFFYLINRWHIVSSTLDTLPRYPILQNMMCISKGVSPILLI
ncbi:hypothetical protein Hanom_Chr03g00234601 [Helianthus anomalus]